MFGGDWIGRHAVGMLADEPGLGKSLTALLGCKRVNADKVLVTGPAIGLASWTEELRRWAPSIPVHMPTRPDQLDLLPGMTVLTYGQVARLRWRLALRKLWEAKGSWDVAIFDEAHRLKEPEAAVTQALYGVDCRRETAATAARFTWPLTGTPMPNNFFEMWTHLRSLDPRRVTWTGDVPAQDNKPMSFSAFRSHVSHTRLNDAGRDVVVGSRNADWIRQRVTGFVLRRTANDVAADIPAALLQMVPIPVDMDAINTELAALDDAAKALGKVPNTPSASLLDLTDDQFLTLLQTDPSTARMRHALARAKTEPAAEWIETVLLQGGVQKVVVFAYHREVINRLAHKLAGYGVVIVDGAHNSRVERTNAISAFQNNPQVRVFIGQEQAASEMVTLTAANHVVLVETTYSPRALDQMVRRVLRLGQTKPVFGHVLSAAGTLDDRAIRVLVDRTRELNKVFTQSLPALKL